MTSADNAGGADAASRPGADERLRERLISTEVLHRGRVLEFRIDRIETPDGHPSTREVAGHPGGVAILAIDPDGAVLLVRQWRHAIGRALLEIPAGTLDRDVNDTVEHHAEAARRELEEETGYRARSWRYLGGFYTAPGFTNELMHLYLATDLEAASENRLSPDADERLELERLPLVDAIGMAERGELIDAKSIVGLLRVKTLI